MKRKMAVAAAAVLLGALLPVCLSCRNTGQEPERPAGLTNVATDGTARTEPELPGIWERPEAPATREPADLELELETGKREPAPEVIGSGVEYATKEEMGWERKE